MPNDPVYLSTAHEQLVRARNEILGKHTKIVDTTLPDHYKTIMQTSADACQAAELPEEEKKFEEFVKKQGKDLLEGVKKYATDNKSATDVPSLEDKFEFSAKLNEVNLALQGARDQKADILRAMDAYRDAGHDGLHPFVPQDLARLSAAITAAAPGAARDAAELAFNNARSTVITWAQAEIAAENAKVPRLGFGGPDGAKITRLTQGIQLLGGGDNKIKLLESWKRELEYLTEVRKYQNSLLGLQRLMIQADRDKRNLLAVLGATADPATGLIDRVKLDALLAELESSSASRAELDDELLSARLSLMMNDDDHVPYGIYIDQRLNGYSNDDIQEAAERMISAGNNDLFVQGGTEEARIEMVKRAAQYGATVIIKRVKGKDGKEGPSLSEEENRFNAVSNSILAVHKKYKDGSIGQTDRAVIFAKALGKESKLTLEDRAWFVGQIPWSKNSMDMASQLIRRAVTEKDGVLLAVCGNVLLAPGEKGEHYRNVLRQEITRILTVTIIPAVPVDFAADAAARTAAKAKALDEVKVLYDSIQTKVSSYDQLFGRTSVSEEAAMQNQDPGLQAMLALFTILPKDTKMDFIEKLGANKNDRDVNAVALFYVRDHELMNDAHHKELVEKFFVATYKSEEKAALITEVKARLRITREPTVTELAAATPADQNTAKTHAISAIKKQAESFLHDVIKLLTSDNQMTREEKKEMMQKAIINIREAASAAGLTGPELDNTMKAILTTVKAELSVESGRWASFGYGSRDNMLDAKPSSDSFWTRAKNAFTNAPLLRRYQDLKAAEEVVNSNLPRPVGP